MTIQRSFYPITAAFTAADKPAGPPPTIKISYMTLSTSYVWAGSGAHSLDFFSSMELVTTDTELNAIAAPAIIGFRNPNAATGMPMQL